MATAPPPKKGSGDLDLHEFERILRPELAAAFEFKRILGPELNCMFRPDLAATFGVEIFSDFVEFITMRGNMGPSSILQMNLLNFLEPG